MAFKLTAKEPKFVSLDTLAEGQFFLDDGYVLVLLQTCREFCEQSKREVCNLSLNAHSTRPRTQMVQPIGFEDIEQIED